MKLMINGNSTYSALSFQGGAFSSIYDPKLLETLDHMLSLDLKSVVALTQLAVPHLEKVNGVIVNISSILGQRPVI